MPKEQEHYGFILLRILMLLRRKPLFIRNLFFFRLSYLLSRRIFILSNEQAVDIYNDLKFLREPWHFFPEIKNLVKPDDYLAQHTFDHFIYADGEFTSYLVNFDDKYLRKLVVTLYRETKGEHFYRDEVNFRAAKLEIKAWQLQLVFFTFSHVRQFIVKRCKNLLPSRPAEGNEKPKCSFPMWDDVKHSAVRTLVFGDFTAIGRANVYDVLDHLEKIAKEKKENAKA